jgi:hypothetical protein
MCAHDVKPIKKTTGVGYKVFDVREGKLFSEMMQCGVFRPVRKWLKASGPGPELYGAGWHIFTTARGAQGWGCDINQVIRKVKYRRAFLTGKQTCGNVIIAKEILILRGAKQ